MRRSSIHLATVACALFAVGFASAALAATGSETKVDAAGQYRKWIAEMKDDARGPFSSIKWFCKDGRVLAPQDYACAKKGEGWQHGEWSDRTKQLRSQGYKVANVLAGIDATKAVADPAFPDAYAQLLIERFLIATDGGWILRKAQFYRGAIQEEDEREAARNLLTAMAAREEWIGYRYPALRAGVRLLPHGADTASAQRVRNMAAAIADRDPAFQRLRVKIHGSPDASDAASVREYASKLADPALKQQADALAAEIDRVYAPRPLGEVLEANAKAFAAAPWLQATLRDARDALSKDGGAANRYLVTANLLASLRDALPKVNSPAARLRVLDLSLAVEAENFRAAAELRAAAARAPRGADVLLLAAGVEAAYGTGAINGRERAELRKSLARLAADEIPLGDYLRELRYLGLVPGWGTQGLRLHFGEAMEKLGEIEPLAELFIQDQLRGSPLLFYSQVLDDLARDANRLAGAQHKLFGRDIGAGFNALNPGLARGVLHANPDMKRLEDFRPDGIYVLPESVADLPPLAGILTAGAGNPLSHVQLLARNLGIPNVAVDASLLPALRAERRQAHRARGEPVRPRADRRRRPAVGRGVRQGGNSGRERHVRARSQEARSLGARLREPRRAAREGLGPDRRPEGREARRAEGAFPGPRRARGRHPVRALPRDRARPALPELRQDGVRVDGGELPQAGGDAGGLARSGRVRREAARGDLLDHPQDRPGPAVPRAAARGDGEGVRRGLPRRRLRAVGHQRRRPPGLHRRGPQPDGLQRRRLRQHREGDLRGLGIALYAARVGVAAVAHERARARLSGGAAPARRCPRTSPA